MTEVKRDEVISWAKNHLANVDLNIKQIDDILFDKEIKGLFLIMFGLLKESAKIIKRLLLEYD